MILDDLGRQLLFSESYVSPEDYLKKITLLSSGELADFANELLTSPLSYGIYGHHVSAPTLEEVAEYMHGL